jgi:hypothetical protein
MPNTQTSVPAFTSGQVLTAQQMMDVNTGIPVFATTTTRDAAFGGTGEKTLAEGQFAYIEASNTTQYYDGAAWQTLTGLALISTTTISASASTLISNCFSSAYTNYRLMWEGVGSADSIITAQLAVGSTAATTNYNRQRLSVASTTVTGLRETSITSFRFGGCQTTRPNSSSVDLFNPAVAVATSYSSFNFYNDGGSTIYFEAGSHTTATAYDSIYIIPSAGNFTGTVSIYGYAK